MHGSRRAGKAMYSALMARTCSSVKTLRLLIFHHSHTLQYTMRLLYSFFEPSDHQFIASNLRGVARPSKRHDTRNNRKPLYHLGLQAHSLTIS